jgi:hypothetical protein
MTRDKCSNRAKPNRQRDRAADACPTRVIRVRAPSSTGQIHARLHSQEALASQKPLVHRTGRPDGEHFNKSWGH